MKIEVLTSFRRDYLRIRNKELIQALLRKLEQIENAKGIQNITGIKKLRGYTTQYRIKVVTEKQSYRIGAIIRKDTIWLVRFLPRNKIYKEFP